MAVPGVASQNHVKPHGNGVRARSARRPAVRVRGSRLSCASLGRCRGFARSQGAALHPRRAHAAARFCGLAIRRSSTRTKRSRRVGATHRYRDGRVLSVRQRLARSSASSRVNPDQHHRTFGPAVRVSDPGDPVRAAGFAADGAPRMPRLSVRSCDMAESLARFCSENPPKILIAYGKAVPVQFEGLEAMNIARERESSA